MKRYSSLNADRKMYTICDGIFFHGWMTITIYRYQWLFLPTFAVFRTRYGKEWRIGFNWLNIAISFRICKSKEE